MFLHGVSKLEGWAIWPSKRFLYHAVESVKAKRRRDGESSAYPFLELNLILWSSRDGNSIV